MGDDNLGDDNLGDDNLGDDNLGDDNFGEGSGCELFLSSSSSSSIMTISPAKLFVLPVLSVLFFFEDSTAVPSQDDFRFGETSFSSLPFFDEGVDGFLPILSLLDLLDGVPFPSEECFLDLLGVFSLSTLCFLDLDFEGDSSSTLFLCDFPVGDLVNTLSELCFFEWLDNG